MKKLIVIGGPTASGKTSLAIDLAIRYNTCILSADSRQCFRELTIGVAKPSQEQLQKVQHYFINSHSIHEEISAGIFEKYALEKLAEIYKNHDIVICVGGTGMYLKALCEGLDEMPTADKSIQHQIEIEYQQKGLDWLQKTLLDKDPQFLSTGEQHNPHRLLRALGFKLSHGKSINDFKLHAKKNRPFEIIAYAIDMDRNTLYESINHRVDQMIEQGLVAEAQSLANFKQLKSLNTVGYTELFMHFDGEISMKDAIVKIKQHSRNYAKRQMTWFRHQGPYKVMNREKIITELLTINL